MFGRGYFLKSGPFKSDSNKLAGTCRSSKLAEVACVVLVTAPFAVQFISWNSKARKCRTCFGAGHNSCSICHGRGKVGGCFANADPLTGCQACEGRGRSPCTACNKTGLANNWLWSPKRGPGKWGAFGEW